MIQKAGPIGIFDSGYGGLTVFTEIIKELPQYDYIYLGDNARVPYGSRSFETVYRYTLECVNELFEKGCHLVLIACNTASAKALRNIQHLDLPKLAGLHRVLGVIRPTTDLAGTLTKTGHIGIFATTGTVESDSYPVEIHKFFPDIKVYQQACPMWVSIVENHEHESPGADYYVEKYINSLLKKSSEIDTVVLACTHYPLLINKIKQFLPAGISVISQGDIVAKSFADYLNRHPEIDMLCTKNSKCSFYTTESAKSFNEQAGIFFGRAVNSTHLDLGK